MAATADRVVVGRVFGGDYLYFVWFVSCLKVNNKAAYATGVSARLMILMRVGRESS